MYRFDAVMGNEVQHAESMFPPMSDYEKTQTLPAIQNPRKYKIGNPKNAEAKKCKAEYQLEIELRFAEQQHDRPLRKT